MILPGTPDRVEGHTPPGDQIDPDVDRDGRSKRGPVLVILVAALVLALPVAFLVLRGVTTLMTSLGMVMAFDVTTAILFSIILLPRILGSLWAYFKVDNMWGNEVGYMAIFLLIPIVGIILYLIMAGRLNRPPPGYEYARIENGIVHQPIFEYVGHPQSQAHQAPPLPQQPPPQQPPQQQPPPGYPPQVQHPPPHQQPYSPYIQQRPGYPPVDPYQQGYSPPQWAQHMYGEEPYRAHTPPPTAFPPGHAQSHYGPQVAYGAPVAPRPYGQHPLTGYKKIGERQVQKRDYLAWHNVVLLMINAMLLASFVLGLIIYPYLISLEGIDDAALIEFPSNATFVLFTLIIQDGILIWMVWHQVVRRRVIPLTEMGISKATLTDSAKMARFTALGIVFGLALFGIAIAIELGQAALGFVPPEDAIVVGPTPGNLGAYMTWLISGCIIAPISEEFFFRGYGFYAFNKRYGLSVALFVSALGFSAIHGSIYSLLPIFAAGIGLALAYHWTGSLVPPMVAHAVNNLIALTLMYIGFY